MWNAVDAVYPSIYFGLLPSQQNSSSPESNAIYVEQTVGEAVRLAAQVGRRSSRTSSSRDIEAKVRRPEVMPTTWYFYDNYPRTPEWYYVNAKDLEIMMVTAMQQGADGLLMWGAVDNATTTTTALQLFVDNIMSPIVDSICHNYTCSSSSSTSTERASGSSGSMVNNAVSTSTVPQIADPLYLSSFSYTKPSGGGAAGWTADDWITTTSTGEKKPWQTHILVTGDDTAFAGLSAAVLRKTGVNLPVLWYWGGWLQYGGNATAVAASWQSFKARQTVLQGLYPHLPSTPYGIYVGDEPDLAGNPARQKYLADGLVLVKESYPEAVTYLNMLFASLGCPVADPDHTYYGLCKTRSNMSTNNFTALAISLGQMELDWMSTDEYYDVSIEQYQTMYAPCLGLCVCFIQRTRGMKSFCSNHTHQMRQCLGIFAGTTFKC